MKEREDRLLNRDIEKVKQFKIFFSNRLELLGEKLFSHLYTKDADPFAKRLVIVPNRGVKFWLERFFAKKAIFFDLEIALIDRALATLMIRSPSPLALTLAINETLFLEEMEGDPLLAEKLAFYFRRYALYGYELFSRWEENPQRREETIWKQLFGKKGTWVPLARALMTHKEVETQCYLFGCSHLSKPIAHFFREQSAYFYQFSFCEAFWSDLLSDHEILHLRKRGDLSYIEEGPPLLANFATVMRKGLIVLEEGVQESEEEYQHIEPKSQLHRLQENILTFERNDHGPADHSLQIHHSFSRRREVENIRNRLLYWTGKEGRALDEVLILAPDISLYKPYLDALLPFPITYLEGRKKEEASVMEAVILLLQLEKERFSSRAVLELLSHPLVRKKERFSDEDLAEIHFWMRQVQIRWGYDLEHKNRLLKHNKPLVEDHNSFLAGLNRLLEAICEEGDLVKISRLELLYQFYKIVTRFYEELSFFYGTKRRTFREYVERIQTGISCFFVKKRPLFLRK